MPTSAACCWRRRAMSKAALALNLYCARLVDEEHAAKAAGEAERHRERRCCSTFLTPIAKSWPSQWCLEANNLAIQVHGGYGYTREYNVEQFYRDNRLNPIHEGTHGIQGLDLLGRKVVMQDGAALRLVGERLRATCRARVATGDKTLARAGRRARQGVAAAGGSAAALWSQGTTSRSPMPRSIWRRSATWWWRGSGWSRRWWRRPRCRRRQGERRRRFLSRQAGGGGVLLPLRAAEGVPAARPAGHAGPYDAGHAGRTGSDRHGTPASTRKQGRQACIPSSNCSTSRARPR